MRIYVKRPLAERFWVKVDRRQPNECWPWLGATNSNGYGRVLGDDGVVIPATHAVLRLQAGTRVPAGYYVCHHCDNPLCVNPSHLFVGTPSDNARDMTRKGRALFPRAKGSRNGNAKLTEASVADIRRRLAAKVATQEQLAAEYGVSQAVISAAWLRTTWRHVGTETEGQT